MNTSNKDHNCPLHLAIKKYGKENFKIEKIEECNNSILNERECFWIDYFSSYKNGYNASIGGDGHTKYDYDQIVEYYLNNNCSLLKTCQYFHIYDQVVYTALQNKQIDYKNIKPQKTNIKPIRKKILLIEKNLIFNSMKDIDQYFKKTAHPNVRRCLNGITEKAYGFHWKELENDEIIEGSEIY